MKLTSKFWRLNAKWLNYMRRYSFSNYNYMNLQRTRKTRLATYGTLRYNDFECKTIELPWLDNEPSISCIPEGMYDYEVIDQSPSIDYPHVWIKDVPGRAGIKIHVANYVFQLRGCIAVGKDHKDIDRDGVIDVTESRNTLNKLLKVVPRQGKIQIQ